MLSIFRFFASRERIFMIYICPKGLLCRELKKLERETDVSKIANFGAKITVFRAKKWIFPASAGFQRDMHQG